MRLGTGEDCYSFQPMKKLSTGKNQFQCLKSNVILSVKISWTCAKGLCASKEERYHCTEWAAWTLRGRLIHWARHQAKQFQLPAPSKVSTSLNCVQFPQLRANQKAFDKEDNKTIPCPYLLESWGVSLLAVIYTRPEPKSSEKFKTEKPWLLLKNRTYMFPPV